MIVGKFYNGSGLGNMLHRYVATRVLALDKGYKFSMVYVDDGAGKEQGFKGQSFMSIDWGTEPYPMPNHFFNEKKTIENGVDIRSYDPEINFVEDNTIIDGEFQDERYWEHRESEVDEWLKVELLEVPEDVCVIGFRGGEFALYPDLFLPKQYYDEAIIAMQNINPKMKFEVHTDDEVLAKQCFPDFKVTHDIGINWRSMRYAKYAIIANSSFFIFPRWLRQHIVNPDPADCDSPITIAPRYWGRHNTKVWSLPQNYYKRFKYI